MTKRQVIQAQQLCLDQFARLMHWNCDEYVITYNRKTHVLTVEYFEGFTDDGDEITQALPEAEAAAVVKQYEPGWIGLDGFVKLQDYYGDRWNIGSSPV